MISSTKSTSYEIPHQILHTNGIRYYQNLGSQRVSCKVSLLYVCCSKSHYSLLVQAVNDNAQLRQERDQLVQEKDELLDQIKQLKAGDLLTEELSEKGRVIYESQGTNKGIYETGSDRPTYDELSKQLAKRNTEIFSLKVSMTPMHTSLFKIQGSNFKL